jgi:PIN domain nuclease of toxin-antitoxin system
LARILLDTSVIVWAYATGIEALPKQVQQLLISPETERLLSSVSLTEITVKTTISKALIFPYSAVLEAIQDMRLTVLPYSPAHALALFQLPFLEDHRDPFDRMLIATALQEKVPIVTGDRQFKRYKGLEVIWK